MDAETLHIVDSLYLKIFQQNLLAELLRTRILLKQHRWQSDSLSTAKALAPEFRQHYAQVSERLSPLIDALSAILNDMEVGYLSWKAVLLPVESSMDAAEVIVEKQAAIARLDTAEADISDVLNDVGELLAKLPSSIVSWHDSALFSVKVELKRLTERPCYDLEFPIAFRSNSFLMADYFSKKHHGYKRGQWPHYLSDDVMPLDLLTLIDDLWIEMDARADGYASWRTGIIERQCI